MADCDDGGDDFVAVEPVEVTTLSIEVELYWTLMFLLTSAFLRRLTLPIWYCAFEYAV